MVGCEACGRRRFVSAFYLSSVVFEEEGFIVRCEACKGGGLFRSSTNLYCCAGVFGENFMVGCEGCGDGDLLCARGPYFYVPVSY